jgi:hypothetical protein
MAGLYARNLLSEDLSNYAIKPAYQTMVTKLLRKKPQMLSKQQYRDLTKTYPTSSTQTSPVP